MSTLNKPAILIVFCSFLFAGCYIEDPGPRQATERSYSIVDFDRLEIGSGLRISVEHGEFYSVTARGDRRNIDDLIVTKEGTTLVVQYSNSRQRRHDTFIEIKSPVLSAVTFSGGSDSKVAGFDDVEHFNVNLSGGSVCQLSLESTQMSIVLSGGSYLNLRGEGHAVEADISGASSLKAFSFPHAQSEIRITGASNAEITVRDLLDVMASGASHLLYRGAPSVTSDVSGASSVRGENN